MVLGFTNGITHRGCVFNPLDDDFLGQFAIKFLPAKPLLPILRSLVSIAAVATGQTVGPQITAAFAARFDVIHGGGPILAAVTTPAHGRIANHPFEFSLGIAGLQTLKVGEKCFITINDDTHTVTHVTTFSLKRL